MDPRQVSFRVLRAIGVRLSGKSGNVDFRLGQWERHKLPDRLDGKSFLDVGCWEGLTCLEAVKRGASSVLGIDYCTSPDLIANRERAHFSFLQMDVFSEKLLELPEFDVVHCAGVLYHVESPLSLLFRLRKLCKLGGLIFVETTYLVGGPEVPMLAFHPGSTMDDNPSNWWSPNETCLREMLSTVGLKDLEVTYRLDPEGHATEWQLGRITMRGLASNTPTSITEKVLPRRPSFMPSSPGGGNRAGVKP